MSRAAPPVASPPRPVPFAVRVRLLLGGAAMWSWLGLALMTLTAGPFLVRVHLMGAEVSIVAVFPLAALVAVGVTLRRGLRHVRLVRDRDPAFWRRLPFHPLVDAGGRIQPVEPRRSLLLLFPPALAAAALALVLWTAPDRGARHHRAPPPSPAGLEVERRERRPPAPATLEVERDDAGGR